MIPTCYPTNASGEMVIAVYSPGAGDREWFEYIPMQAVTDVAAGDSRYEENGHLNVDHVTPSGKVAWVDYVPFVVVTGRADRWKTTSDGFIPVVGIAE
jgi:hypothetical protein